MRAQWVLVGTLSLLATTLAASAWAQDDPSDDGASEESAEPDEESAEPDEESAEQAESEQADDEGDETKKKGKEKETTSSSSASSTAEEAGVSYRFVGLRYRGIIIPKFVVNWFADGARTVYVNGVGPEFSMRKDNLEIILSAWYASYHMPETPFKNKHEEEAEAWEVVESNLKMLYLTADLLWSSDLSSKVAINYGVGVGVAPVFGKLYRTQIYPENGSFDPHEPPDEWNKCTGSGAEPPSYCDPDDPFEGDTESSWAKGGSKPFLWPWIALTTGLRYKPHENFVARLDLGVGSSAFFFGIGADYGL